MVTILKQPEGTIDRLIVNDKDSPNTVPLGLVDRLTHTAYLPSDRSIERKVLPTLGWLTTCDAKLAYAYFEDELRRKNFNIRKF